MTNDLIMQLPIVVTVASFASIGICDFCRKEKGVKNTGRIYWFSFFVITIINMSGLHFLFS